MTPSTENVVEKKKTAGDNSAVQMGHDIIMDLLGVVLMEGRSQSLGTF